jgi:hypothetical protein
MWSLGLLELGVSSGIEAIKNLCGVPSTTVLWKPSFLNCCSASSGFFHTQPSWSSRSSSSKNNNNNFDEMTLVGSDGMGGNS